MEEAEAEEGPPSGYYGKTATRKGGKVSISSFDDIHRHANSEEGEEAGEEDEGDY